ncbi:MAG: YceI family protein [Gelidibacter sp.]
MKTFLITILFLSSNCFAQTKYITKSGTVNFEASVPSFEEVAANNNSVTAIINTENGEFAALALVKAFRFKNALMEEHFNENYAESSKFPKATFKGTIEKFSTEKLSVSKNTFNITGQLTFHGVTKDFKCKTLISKIENRISMEGNFKVLASDFGIEIPSIVRNKISEDIMVHFDFELSH